MNSNSRFDNKSLIDNRQIRIFLSSTFSDMQDERSELVKTFEKLKIAAAQRNVTLSLLDLRWGVTDEEARSGKVISVCLNEIEHSHPFFIGLLGNRYGHEFDSTELNKNPDLLERYPWIAEDIAVRRSITEIEILYGALRNYNNPVDAAFYIKQTTEPDDDPRQTALKEKIYGQKLYPVNDYSDVKELCFLVERHVKSMLDRHFPDYKQTPLEHVRTVHRAHINSHHIIFVGREKELECLDAFAHSNHRYLVFTGDSGMGKSALLSNWIRRNEDCVDFNLIYHFIGNSFAENNYESVLRHLCEEIYDIYQIEKDPNRKEKPEDESQRLVSELVNQQKSLVIIIDGINQITAQKDEKLLLWLPVANNKVKFIFTTLCDDPTMQALERRGCEVCKLNPLSDTQRKHFAIKYLEQVGKHLDAMQLQRIIDDPKNRNTLVLQTLLDELICFGSHENLVARINYYLSANGIPNFFDQVIMRMEQDYDNGQELVSHTLRLIALSERGLSEEELLAITGFRQIDWHLFYCAFFTHLVVKEGLITFSHQHVAIAVHNRYSINNPKANARYRQEIVTHFASLVRDENGQHQRCISELAYQYYNLSEWSRLHDILLSFEAFNYFFSNNRVLLANYWRKLIAVDKMQYALSNYLQISPLNEETTLAIIYNNIGSFVSDFFADYENALEYLLKDLAIDEKVLGTEHPSTAISYDNIGTVYWKKGDFVKALEYLFKALEIREKIFGKNHPDTAISYSNIGVIYDELCEYDNALVYYLKSLAIREKVLVANHPDIALSYNNVGTMYWGKGDYDEALIYLFKALRIREKILGTQHPDTAISYNNIGLVYKKNGDFVKALEYYFKALEIREKVFGKDHPDTAISYNNIGTIYDTQGDYDKTIEYYFKALEVFKKTLGLKHQNSATSYNNIGTVYKKQGDYDKSLMYLFKALEIREQILGTNHPDTAISYNNIGTVYDEQGNYDEALEYYFKDLAIIERVLGAQHPDTAVSYDNIGIVYWEKGDIVKALEYLFKALEIREIIYGKDHPDTAISYSNIGVIYDEQGEYNTALKYFNKAYHIYKRAFGPKHPDTEDTLALIKLVKENLNQTISPK